MKAFLLAAGHGTRLRPLTDTIPKCLLPINGTPMLDLWLQTCSRFGITDVLINIHAHADTVRRFIAKRRPSARVHIIEEPELLGSAGTIRENRNWVHGDDSFWVFYADVLHRVNLSAMLDRHRSRTPAATLGVYRVPDPTRCGIVQVQPDHTICEFVEKPSQPQSNLAFSGILLGTPSLLDAIPDKHPADIGFDVLPSLVGNMLAYEISEYLIDIGTMENYSKAQATWPALSEPIPHA